MQLFKTNEMFVSGDIAKVLREKRQDSIFRGVVAEDRIELPTQGFSILCSTD